MAVDAPRTVAGKILPREVEVDPKDPPIFLLQALPTWAPWLPDGSWQRVPVGATGQVLTVNADGSIGWSNSSAGFANPMTTTGDLITSNPGSAPVRLAIGSSGQVLAVVGGLPAWETPPWVVNPLTTQGDIIVEGASAPGRLAIGTVNQVLTSNGTTATWQNSAAGFANPMTTTGDLITSNPGATPVRLGAGATNQVLTIIGGVPTWQNSASGFANPMTSPGDMITGGLAGVATRLAAGTNGQVLTIVSGAPAWGAGAAGASAVVFPSNDTTGVADQAAITATWTSGLVSHGGEVLLASGAFYVKPTAGTHCLQPPVQTVVAPQGSSIQGSPVCVRGLGQATILYPVGAGVTGIWYHRTTSYGGQYGLPAQPQTGYIRDFVIDGSLATGASTGLDWGDGWGYELDLAVVNFTGTGAIGVQQINRVFWTEKNDRIRLRLSNNSTAFYITTALAPGGDHSSEYNMYDISMFCNANQQGIVIDGVNMGGSYMWIRGNMSISNGSGAAPPNNIAALSIINAAGVTAVDGKRWYEGGFYLKVEGNTPGNGTGTTFPYMMYSDGVGYVRLCTGAVFDSNLTASNWNGAEFTFRGVIADPVLAQLVTGPAGSASTYANRAASTATAGNLITFTDGQPSYANGTVVFWLANTGGFSAGTPYYVISASGATCQLSLTPGGAVFTVTSNASGTLDPAGPPMVSSGTIQQNYGPDAMVYMTGGTGVTVATQGSPVPYSASVQNPYFIPAGGSITPNYTTAPTWNWAPCSQGQF